jgi:hypothetical protein
MSRWRELLTHLQYEKQQRGAKPSAFPLLRKILRLAPDGVAFLLFNFGSSFARVERTTEPQPLAPEQIDHLQIEDWPLNLLGAQRGLPHSDGVVERVTFHGYEFVDDPVYALREIHRVCVDDAPVDLRFVETWQDPLQRRVATPAAIAPLLAPDSARGRELGVAGLFAVQSAANGTLRLIVQKSTHHEHPSRIDIGCGLAKHAGYCGLDIAVLPGVDIVCDIARKGLPFSENTITAVIAIHFLEHVFDLVFVMNEIHRVCRDGAFVEIEVPTLLGPWAAADPTHRHLFNARTFGYFTDAASDGYAGIRGRFELVSQQMSTTMRVVLRVLKNDIRDAGTS